jgi:RNA polymerase subunit RPABC4/transcription elongation factor Spt4/TM2 domain-containing membrane protein YozV
MAELGAFELAQLTKDLDDSKQMIFHQQYQSEKKDPGVAIILALFLFDRFWLGDTALGILKYLTFGACGLWGLIDLFTAKGRCNEYNRRKANELLQALAGTDLNTRGTHPIPTPVAPAPALVPSSAPTIQPVSSSSHISVEQPPPPVSTSLQCKKCGQILDEGATFCGECGAKVVRCKKCGQPLEAGSTFCDECGTQVG